MPRRDAFPMTNYRNFIEDFPCRCHDVVAKFTEPAVAEDREVTLVLMAVAAGFVVVYERLSEGKSVRQPSLDRPLYATASGRLQQLLAERIDQSVLFASRQDCWRGGRLTSTDGDPDSWPELASPEAFPPETRVSKVFDVIRHAIAHGNILSRPDSGGQISELIFVSGGNRWNGRSIPYEFVIVSPSNLRRFLEEWFRLLKEWA